MIFKITDEFLDLITKQITQAKVDLDFYNRMSKSEFEVVKDFIAEPKNILELGCGLGRMSIYLNSRLKSNPHFILADFSEESERVKYGWNPGESYYNNLELTSRFSKTNNLNNFEILNLREDKISKLKEIDLVMSFLSVGFHYPIEPYVEDLLKITTSDVTMIFGIRDGKYNEKSFENYFESSIILNNEIDNTKEKILILKGKK